MSLNPKLVGAWLLSESQTFDLNGNPLSEPFSQAAGILSYSDSGYMSAQLQIPEAEGTSQVQ